MCRRPGGPEGDGHRRKAWWAWLLENGCNLTNNKHAVAKLDLTASSCA